MCVIQTYVPSNSCTERFVDETFGIADKPSVNRIQGSDLDQAVGCSENDQTPQAHTEYESLSVRSSGTEVTGYMLTKGPARVRGPPIEMNRPAPIALDIPINAT